MTSIEDIITSATLREEVVSICVAGALNAEHDRLDAQLRQLDEKWEPTSLSDADPRRDIAERVVAVERQMAEHRHEFRFRAMPWTQFRLLRAEHTGTDGLSLATFVPTLLHRCAVSPTFADTDEVQRLLDVLTERQVDELFGAAWKANTGAADIPKSVAASALMASSGPK